MLFPQEGSNLFAFCVCLSVSEPDPVHSGGAGDSSPLEQNRVYVMSSESTVAKDHLVLPTPHQVCGSLSTCVI